MCVESTEMREGDVTDTRDMMSADIEHLPSKSQDPDLREHAHLQH